MSSDYKNGYNILVILAISLLAVSLILPFFDVWGGLFPDWDDADTFIDVIEEISDDFDDIWYYCPAAFRMSAFIPCVFLLITSLCKSKAGCVITSGAGVGLLVINLMRFISESGADEVFDMDDGSVSFGFWVALILFVICFVQSLRADN